MHRSAIPRRPVRRWRDRLTRVRACPASRRHLLGYATSVLAPVAGVRLVGTARDKASVLSFVLKGYTTAEVGQALSEEGIAVRAGHHCAQPILRRFGLEASVRPSLAFYNTGVAPVTQDTRTPLG
nr:aminotransferase class V-fold PLP-dependent enzyme [Burkholderia multivorans]